MPHGYATVKFVFKKAQNFFPQKTNTKSRSIPYSSGHFSRCVMFWLLAPDAGLSVAESVLAPNTRVVAPVARNRCRRGRALVLHLLVRCVLVLGLGTAEAVCEGGRRERRGGTLVQAASGARCLDRASANGCHSGERALGTLRKGRRAGRRGARSASALLVVQKCKGLLGRCVVGRRRSAAGAITRRHLDGAFAVGSCLGLGAERIEGHRRGATSTGWDAGILAGWAGSSAIGVVEAGVVAVQSAVLTGNELTTILLTHGVRAHGAVALGSSTGYILC
jgi:hypothetical protein